MKIFLTKLSSSFLFFLLPLSMVWAKPVAQVTEVSGTVFVVSSDGKTSALKINQHLDDRSEVMVDEGSYITLNDYYDSTYHLIGGSYLKFFDKSVQLKKGKAWVKSSNSTYPLALTTANGHVYFGKSEFIATFDQMTSKSQFLVVNGEVEVSNILDKNRKYNIAAGSFTMINPEVENGIPRAPTKVGIASLNSALSEFKQLPAQLKAEPTGRSIASVEKNEPQVIKKGEITFITSNRLPASVEVGSARDYYIKKIGRKSELKPVKVSFYGLGYSAGKAVTQKNLRIPASLHPIGNVPKKVAPSFKNDQEFTQSLKTHTSQQPNRSKELDNLLMDLRSFE